MPTGNEFVAVHFGQQEQSYKQNEQESRSGEYGNSTRQTEPAPSAGSYPSVFDRQAGSEPLATGEAQNYYPEKVFQQIDCTGPGQSYVQSERESVSGEYDQAAPGNFLGKFTNGDDIVPEPVQSKQFHGDKEGDPKKLVRQATASIGHHSDLLKASGLRMPIATYGTHPWLRDELSTPGEEEPGQAEPDRDLKVPLRKSV